MTANPRMGWVLLREVPTPQFPPFVIGTVVHDVTTVMYGRPEAGKSFVALSMAASLMTGQPWLGHPVREVRRVAYWMLDPGQVAQTKRRVQTIAGLHDLVVSARRPPRAEEGWQSEADQLRRLEVDFVIIDNLTRLMPGGQSVRNDEAVEPVLRNISIMEQHGIAVLLIHHAGKPGEDGNPKTTPLGATAIESWGDHFIRVDAVKDKDSRRISRKAVSYGNDLEEGEVTIPFAIRHGQVVADSSQRRDAERDQERLAAMKARQWKNQTEIGEALDIDQGQVSRILKRVGHRLDHASGRVVPKVRPQVAALCFMPPTIYWNNNA